MWIITTESKNDIMIQTPTFRTLMEIDLHFVLYVGRVPRSNPHLHASMGVDRPFDTIIIE